jgi:hypothetical protein
MVAAAYASEDVSRWRRLLLIRWSEFQREITDYSTTRYIIL